MAKKLAAVAAIGAALILTGCGGTSTASSTPTATPTPTEPPYVSKINAGETSCKVSANAIKADVGIEDSGHTVQLHGTRNYSGNVLSIADLECLLEALGSPSSVILQMEQTRALDGMQHATWGTTKATWTYHPDNGLKVILTDQ